MASIEVGSFETQTQDKTVIQNSSDGIASLLDSSAPLGGIQNAASTPPEGTQNSASSTKVPQVWLLNAGDAEQIQKLDGEEQKFWVKIHANVKKCQGDQKRYLAAIDEVEAARRAKFESEQETVLDRLWSWDSHMKAARQQYKSLSDTAAEIAALNDQISKQNEKAGRKRTFGQVMPWPYLKPILSRPGDHTAIEESPEILCAMLKPFLFARKIQKFREDFYSSKASEASDEADIISELEDLNSKIGRYPQIKEARKLEDAYRATHNQNVDEWERLNKEDNELNDLWAKSEKLTIEARAELDKRQEAFNNAKAAWTKVTRMDFDDPPNEYIEFASIYVPDQGERLDLDDELLEPPEVEKINEDSDVSMEGAHIEYESKYTYDNLPNELRRGLELLGKRDGPLHTWVLSVKDYPLQEINQYTGNQAAWNELMAGNQALLLKCDELKIDRAEFSFKDHHLLAFVDMVQQAEAAYLALTQEPQNPNLQQNYTLVRQRAGIWMEQNKFPPSFVDLLVPPEKVIADSVNIGLGLGASDSGANNPSGAPAGAGLEDPPSTPKPTSQRPKPDNLAGASAGSGLGDPSSSPKPTSQQHEVKDPPTDPKPTGSSAADAIPLNDSEDQCAPIVECPPMTVCEDGVYKKVVDVIKIGFMQYGLLKWPGSNPKYPKLFQHELVPATYLGDAVDEFLRRYPQKKFVVASKPTKEMKWDTAQIGGSASVRRDPNVLYKIHAVTYDWVKFKGQKLQHYRRSDLIKTFNRQRVETKINDYLEKAGQKSPVPPADQVFVKELPTSWRQKAKNKAKKISKKTKKRRLQVEETDDEGESIHSDEESSEEEEDEGYVSDLINDEEEEDIEEIKRKNNEKYWKMRREELEKEEKAWRREQEKKRAKTATKGKEKEH